MLRHIHPKINRKDIYIVVSSSRCSLVRCGSNCRLKGQRFESRQGAWLNGVCIVSSVCMGSRSMSPPTVKKTRKIDSLCFLKLPTVVFVSLAVSTLTKEQPVSTARWERVYNGQINGCLLIAFGISVTFF